MKKIRSLLIIAFLTSGAFCKGQSLVDCGLTYFYDAAGNRILRMVVQCGAGTGRHTDTSATVAITTDIHSDTTTLGKFEIVLMAPNPTGGPFHITCNQDLDNANVTIIDLTGQVVSQTTVSGREVPMDISHLAPGTYQVIVTTSNSATAKSIVKTH